MQYLNAIFDFQNISLRLNITKYLTKWVGRLCNLCRHCEEENDGSAVQTCSTVCGKSKSSKVDGNCEEVSASI